MYEPQYLVSLNAYLILKSCAVELFEWKFEKGVVSFIFEKFNPTNTNSGFKFCIRLGFLFVSNIENVDAELVNKLDKFINESVR